MTYRPAWAAGSFSSVRSAAGTVGTKSTEGSYRPDVSPCTTENEVLITDFQMMLEYLAPKCCAQPQKITITQPSMSNFSITTALNRARDRYRTWPGSATTGTPGIQRAPSFFPMMAASTPPRQIFTPLQLARPHKPGNDTHCSREREKTGKSDDELCLRQPSGEQWRRAHGDTASRSRMALERDGERWERRKEEGERSTERFSYVAFDCK